MASTTWYAGDTVKRYSINFGELANDQIVGANTWDDWHLIPSSRPTIVHPPFVSKYIEIPGVSGYYDMTEYLTGIPIYSGRSGSISFIVDNGHEYWESIRTKIVSMLHGKHMKMQLTDDPDYYYEGRFTVGNWESGGSRSSITISYQLQPYKYKIKYEGTERMIWDTFNFDIGVDYYMVCHEKTVDSGRPLRFTIRGTGAPIAPVVEVLSGSVTAHFAGTYESGSAGEMIELPASDGRDAEIEVLGNNSGVVNIWWRGASL